MVFRPLLGRTSNWMVRLCCKAQGCKAQGVSDVDASESILQGYLCKGNDEMTADYRDGIFDMRFGRMGAAAVRITEQRLRVPRCLS
jgi:hypothetical protein